eukprot:CAMPEP_0204904664 /NCGR_PEP_ID=MMETSP1397-20131031/4988_1 /ASSEMBLY_ACC=CAM_ASM_000891 /TAXON_ID=49980 /ORGANISM="Climacostomum Climacostomum virens, Strain Stock W-24" /LENGTH=489 /DNA_ID=CAMNT_0052073473 /DNA_START=29 /DNA_END=1498 /DNA_ORIENTATION=+
MTAALQDTCDKQEDCRALSECDKDECIHKKLQDPAPSEYVGIVIIFIVCGAGAGTGLGGGPLMTPIFILIWFFSSHDAIPLAQIVIFAASITTIGFRVLERNPRVNRPMMHWDLLILLQSPIICGTLFGVLINFSFPEWLILILLELLLLFGTYTTAKKTIENRRKELAERQKASTETEAGGATEMAALKEEPKIVEPTDRPPRSDDSDNPDSSNSSSSSSENHDADQAVPDEVEVKEAKPVMTPGLAQIEKEYTAKVPWKHATVIFFTHAFMVIAILIRGGMGAKSIAGIAQCSEGFFAWIPLFIIICALIGVANSIYVYRRYQWHVAEGYPFLPDDIRWTPKKMVQFMVLAIFAGVASGALGAGGGTTMGPLLLLLGVNPQVVASTAALLVFYTSSIASLTFTVAGRVSLDYGLLILFMCLLSGVSGVLVIRWLVKKFKRPSIITLIMTIFLASAAAAIIIFGVMSSVSKAKRGILTAKFNDLCAGT